MKKTILLLIALYCSISVFAANFDVIIKTNSEKIEAFIQEVGENELRYKKVSNPNGPTFVISLSQVASILYSNGEVQAIQHTLSQTNKNNESSTLSNLMPDGMMRHLGGDVYSVNGRTFKGKELELFLQQTCPDSYSYYKKQETMELAGYCLLGAGIPICLVVGVTTLCCSRSWDGVCVGAFFTALGGAASLSSVPLITLGNLNKKKVDEVYNLQCNKHMAFESELKLISGEKGLGIAFAF